MIITLWEAYGQDSQKSVIARTEEGARNAGHRVFGSIDLVQKARIELSDSETLELDDNGFIYGN